MPPLFHSPIATARPGPPWRLSVIALGVILAHAALLFGSPQRNLARSEAVPYGEFRFSTYTVESPPRPAETFPPDPTINSRSKAERTTAAVQRVAPAPVDVVTFEEQGPPDGTPPEAEAASEPEATSNSPTQGVVALAAPPQTSVATASVPQPASSGAAKDAVVSPRVVVPPPARLLYDVKGEIKGFPYHVNGELLWTQDGATYNARMEIRHFLLGSRVQTSTGALSAQGLEPTRFGDKVKSEVAAHFERDKGKISFSANTPDAPLQPGAQDQLSVLVQVAALVAAQADHLSRGTVLAFQAVGPRSAEIWRFTVGDHETLTLPGGTVQALRLWRDPLGDYDPTLEIWLAAEQGYLPVRIRLSQRNGDVVDQLWRETRKP